MGMAKSSDSFPEKLAVHWDKMKKRIQHDYVIFYQIETNNLPSTLRHDCGQKIFPLVLRLSRI